jgi:hypothetical protein
LKFKIDVFSYKNVLQHIFMNKKEVDAIAHFLFMRKQVFNYSFLCVRKTDKYKMKTLTIGLGLYYLIQELEFGDAWLAVEPSSHVEYKQVPILKTFVKNRFAVFGQIVFM